MAVDIEGGVMTDFQLDTSGFVDGPDGLHDFWSWPDLSLFTQGYIEVLLRSVSKPFEVGKAYQTQAGNSVTVIKASAARGYESVQCDDPEGGDPEGGWRYNRASDRGRVTGSAFDMSDPRNLVPVSPAFSDLAPETLARIIEDCAQFRRYWPDGDDHASAGGAFWILRQRGSYVGGLILFRPLTLSLGDDGKVRFDG